MTLGQAVAAVVQTNWNEWNKVSTGNSETYSGSIVGGTIEVSTDDSTSLWSQESQDNGDDCNHFCWLVELSCSVWPEQSAEKWGICLFDFLLYCDYCHFAQLLSNYIRFISQDAPTIFFDREQINVYTDDLLNECTVTTICIFRFWKNILSERMLSPSILTWCCLEPFLITCWPYHLNFLEDILVFFHTHML